MATKPPPAPPPPARSTPPGGPTTVVVPPAPVRVTPSPTSGVHLPPGRDVFGGDFPGRVDVGTVIADKLAATAKPASQLQITCAAQDALIPVVYGMQRIGGLIANALHYNGFWVFWVIWCEGEIADYGDVFLNDVKVPTNYIYLGGNQPLFYKGGADNEASYSTLLHNAFVANGVADFTEKLSGIAYSVIYAPYADITTQPAFTATIWGSKVYDPRSLERGWSNNPSLILADYLTNTRWGAGLQVDWHSVRACADLNDTLLIGTPAERRGLCDIVIDREASVDSWIETLRAAAGVFLVNNGGTVKLLPDHRYDQDVSGTAIDPLTTYRSYSHANGDIIELSQVTLRDAVTLPTVMEVQYTDTSKVPWETTTLAPVVRPGNVPYRKSTVPMPWITRAAVERLNKLWLTNMTCQLHVFDEGIADEPGDIVLVTYPEAGLESPKPYRVLTNQATTLGWLLTLEKHDPSAYSDVIETGPGVSITDLQSPWSPPPMANHFVYDEAVNGRKDVVEDVYPLQTGVYASRLKLTWDDMRANVDPNAYLPDGYFGYPYVANYIVSITTGTTTGEEAVVGPVLLPPNVTTYVSPALEEGKDYHIRVWVVSMTGAAGTPGEALYVNLGKLKHGVPSNVPAGSFYGYEAGGEVYLYWAAATDLDLTGYEIRIGDAWGTDADAGLLQDGGTVVARVPAPLTNITVRDIAAGTYYFWIKATDSVRTLAYPYGQYSRDATRTVAAVTVTSDADAYTMGSYAFTSPTLTHMTAQTMGGTTFWVTDWGQTWDALFGATVMNDLTRPLFTYHTGGTSTLLTETTPDYGEALSGDWRVVGLDYTDLYPTDGTATAVVEFSLDNSNWTPFPIGAAVRATGRWARVRVTTGATVMVNALPRIELALPTRRESSTHAYNIPADRYDIDGRLVELANVYSAVKSITVQVVGAQFIVTTIDRILVAPVAGLYFTTTHQSGGNQYTIWQIATGGYTIQSNDYLEFDAYLLPTSADVSSSYCIGAMDIYFTDASSGRSAGLVDQYGCSLFAFAPSMLGAAGRWVTRRVNLAAVVGKTVAQWCVTVESDTAGQHEGVYRNVRVTNGAGGATRLSIYSSGEPSYNGLLAQSGQSTNVMAGPANSFLIYAFTAAGGDTTAQVTWLFEGV
jgi:hypothetical protein